MLKAMKLITIIAALFCCSEPRTVYAKVGDPVTPSPPSGTVATRQARLTNNNGLLNNFGGSVALSGSTAVVGTGLGNAAYVFQHTATGWSVPVKLINLNGLIYQVAISLNTIVLSGAGSVPNTSNLYVFVKNLTGNWIQQAKIIPPANCFFNNKIAVDLNNIAVGGNCLTASGGKTTIGGFVYARSNGLWSIRSKLVSSEGVPAESIAIQGDKIVMGNYFTSHAAYIFQRVSGTWSQKAKLTVSAVFNDFGRSVAINGTSILVGAPTETVLNESKGKFMFAAGAVYAFENTGAWVQSARLTAGSKASNNNQFGASASISGNRAVIGNDTGFAEPGNAYVFQKISGLWNPNSYVVGPLNAALGYRFGYSVSLDGNSFLVGAPGEPPGISPYTAGAAYLFTLPII